MPQNGLSDMTNAWLTQDSLPTPRPSLVRYGAQPLGTMIGVSTFTKIVAGRPERWEISMQAIAGVGKICIRKDGDVWTNIGGTYNDVAIVTFAQSNSRVYLANGVDAMSYYDIDTGTIYTYSALIKPNVPTAVKTGLAGTNYTFYYRVSASNNVGETEGSVAVTISTDKLRNDWIDGTDKVTLSWTAVTGTNVTYNIYVGTAAGNEKQIATGISAITFVDNGTAAANPFKIAPSGNSTQAPKLTYIYNKNGQIYGVGDIENPYYLWYSGVGEQSGDFSPFSGGGYVGIDFGGDTLPVNVRAFRDGKGTPAMTVLSQGAAGSGKLSHVTFQTQTVGNTTFTYPEVYEANGQAGTVSPRGVIEANNSLYYPTGSDFKTTGSKPNVMNILSTDSISQGILPDVQGLNLAAMKNVVGLEYQDKLYWSLPFGSNENSEIWIMDLSRGGVWILRWTIPAKLMWLYEDNDGYTHHCVLVNNVILEFTDSVKTTDDGVAFRVRVATGRMVFDKAGVGMAAIQFQRFKVLYPTGTINFNVYGLGESGQTTGVANTSFRQAVSYTGWEQWLYDNQNEPAYYDGDIGVISSVARSMEVVPVEVDEILNEISDEITSDTAGVDFTLSSISTQGVGIDRYFYGE
jgi:hypothetical protein